MKKFVFTKEHVASTLFIQIVLWSETVTDLVSQRQLVDLGRHPPAVVGVRDDTGVERAHLQLERRRANTSGIMGVGMGYPGQALNNRSLISSYYTYYDIRYMVLTILIDTIVMAIDIRLLIDMNILEDVIII